MNAQSSPRRAPGAYRAPAVSRAFHLLEAVASARGPVTLSELARRLGYSKGTLHGLIRALLDCEALCESPRGRGYAIGPAVVELAFRSRNFFRIGEQAQPVLDALRDRIGETVCLGVLSRSRGLIVATAEAGKPFKISAPPGTAIPLLAGAVGKVFLAGLPRSRADALIREQGLPAYTPRTITDRRRYLAELETVRRRGFAVDREEYLPGVAAVAVALGSPAGLPLALWVVGLAETMDDSALESIAGEMRDAARRLQEILARS
ncbi:MAG: IclR family transcriptional regulator [Desulfobacterales bacterium]